MKSIFTMTCTFVERRQKIFALFFFLIAWVGLSRAATSGSCGKNLTWEFNTETNTLIITGTGAMADYTTHYTNRDNTAPWWSDWSYYRITSISLPEGLTHIGEYAFWQCVKVQSVTLPSTLKTIGENGFCYMGARTITLPEGVTSVGMEAFELCEWLTSVTLPASLTYIGHRAFGRCVKLKSVYNYAVTPQTLQDEVFQEIDLSQDTLYVPWHSIPAYQAAAVWKDFGTITYIPGTEPVSYNSGSVEIEKLRLDDTLKAGVTLTASNMAYTISFPANRSAYDSGKSSANYTVAFSALTTPLLGHNASLSTTNAQGDTVLITPVDEDGRHADVWVVTAPVGTEGSIELAGIRTDDYSCFDPKASFTASQSSMNVGYHVYPNLYTKNKNILPAVTVTKDGDTAGEEDYTLESEAYNRTTSCFPYHFFPKAAGRFVLTVTQETNGIYYCAAEDSLVIIVNDAAAEAIDAIGTVAYTAQSKSLIAAARATYNGLTDEAKALVSADKLQLLVDAETTYAQLVAAAVAAVMAQIDALPDIPLTAETGKLAEYNKVKAARAAYDALADTDKTLVTNYSRLTDAEVAFAVFGSDDIPAGVLNSVFTINAGGDLIYFSKGNLQATTTDLGTTWTWGFAANQYDCIGDNAANTKINSSGKVSGNGTVDLFGWSTASTYYGICSGVLSSSFSGDFVDWGATIGSDWRTLTKDEWDYLLNTRTTTSGVRYAKATISDVNIPGTSKAVTGLIIVPDDWKTSYYTLADCNTATAGFSTNTITSAVWENKLQAHGAVFLPAAGQRGLEVREVGEWGYYWTATDNGANYAFSMCLYGSGVEPGRSLGRQTGASVRLVKKTSVDINPLAYAKEAVGLINAIPQPVVLTDACKAAIDTARVVLDALNETAKSLLNEADTIPLPQAEAAYAALIAEQVAQVIALIDTLPGTPLTAETSKLTEYNKVKAAREAYNALADKEKALITNYSRLTDAEAAFAALGEDMPTAALNSAFTVNAGGDQVSFSKGNLQATTTDLGATWTWGFAANQWTVIGNAAANTKLNGNHTVSENGTVDLFGWSTTANYYGVHNSEGPGNYSGNFVDWGATIGSGWRTLTHDEWTYLLQTRPNATQLRAPAKVHNVAGLILMPDGSIPTVSLNTAATDFTANTISDSDWALLEEQGAVFLPAAGVRTASTADYANARGYYWSATPVGADNAYGLYFNGASINLTYSNSRYFGFAVRLVNASPLAYAKAVVALINAIPQPVVLTDECKAAIDTARAALDALGEGAKALLVEADTIVLPQAEEAYANLLEEKVASVIAAIDALPVTPLTTAAKKLSEYYKVKAAREMYDALINTGKAAVSNYSKLTDAEEAYAALRDGGTEPAGALPGAFSVSGDRMVYFSRGNLQATTTDLGTTWTWGFAANQWTVIRNATANTNITGNGTVSENGTVDLFGWSTSATKYGIHNSVEESFYSGDFVDWGTTMGDGWLTLTAEEWSYILQSRPNAAQLRAVAWVHGVSGLILLPDGCTPAVPLNTTTLRYDVNSISNADWALLEAQGAVFLPTDCRRDGQIVPVVSSTLDLYTYYWTATPNGSDHASVLTFDGFDQLKIEYDLGRHWGCSVRLVTGKAPVGVDIFSNLETVIALINAIPQPVAYDKVSKNAIDTARAALNALDDNAKSMFIEADTIKLPQAEAAYAVLVAEKAAPVIAAIDALPTIPLTEETKKLSVYNNVKAVRAMYEALTDAEKAVVSNYRKLTDLEAAFASINVGDMPDGALSGAFTINADGDQIAFSKGNLQATTADLGTTWVWGFAANQYDYIGINAANTMIVGNDTVSENGTVDLFGWSTASTYYGIHNSSSVGDYSGDFVDWGSTMGDGWRTLTAEEWRYLLRTRPNASSLRTPATVHGVAGWIILPDDYTPIVSLNIAATDYTDNIISDSDWTSLELGGAVFLPAAGYRYGTTMVSSIVGYQGYYWSATPDDTNNAFFVFLNNNGFNPAVQRTRYNGLSVRLVTKRVPTTIEEALALINAIPQPVVLTDECKAAIDTARVTLDALGKDAKAMLTETDTIKLPQAEADFAALLAEDVEPVIAAIDALPTTPLTEQTKKISEYNKVKAARALYETRINAVKAAVSNYSKLTDAEEAFAALVMVEIKPAGALLSTFSIADGKTVSFSRGNLQATTTDLGANWTWAFAANQYDIIGNNVANTKIVGNATVSENGTVDLFGWSTTSTYFGIHNSLSGDDYSGDFADWGANMGSDWRTLTKDEWNYLITSRSNAGWLRSRALVHGVGGLILLPDGFSTTVSLNRNAVKYDENTVSDDYWTWLEEQGAIFLPAANSRRGQEMPLDGDAFYWSATPDAANNVYILSFDDGYGDDLNTPIYKIPRQWGSSVRLVTEKMVADFNPLASADAVIALINAIPQPVVLTEECKAAIDTARAALDTLLDNARSLLSEADTIRLPQAEADFAALLAEKVAPVIAAIDALPDTPLTAETSKLSEYNKVKAARAMYEVLTDREKAAVTNYSRLTNAEAAFLAIGVEGLPAGGLSAAFTINAGGDQISFSKGNLQATTTDLGTSWTWGFAANQYDCIGANAANTMINGNGTVSENGIVDLFGWSTTSSTYYGINNSSEDSYYSGDFADWGNVAAGNWRTLTNDEWDYLLNTRTTASGVRYAKATISDVNIPGTSTAVTGLIILPDDWDNSYYTLAYTNTAGAEYYTNTITSAVWENKLQIHGAVFLPAVGYRNSNSVYITRSDGYYWSATSDGTTNAQCLLFGTYEVDPLYSNDRYYGQCVRLVADKTDAAINPLASAEAVVALINAIPQPVEYTDECKAAIDTAREALDALAWLAKTLLVETDTIKLPQAEADYAALVAEKVAPVIAAIDALPAIPLTEETKKLSEYNKVKAVRAMYDALTDTEKAAVTNYSKLTNVEAAFAALADAFFTINAGGDQVSFSKGNLQATTTDKGATWTWGFATNQYDCIGDNAANTMINGNGTVSENGTVDMFNWSTSANYYGIYNSNAVSDYSGDFVDWGATIGDGWRTLNNDEWNYILNTRTTASGVRYAKATISDVYFPGTSNAVTGLIILPDDWETSHHTLADINTTTAEFSTNTITSAEWENELQAYGAAFLPASGYSLSGSVLTMGINGYYWSATPSGEKRAYYVVFNKNNVGSQQPILRYYGQSVRLVTGKAPVDTDPLADAEAVVALINAIPQPVELTDECKAAIDTARAALDALGERAKALLIEADTIKLPQAEADYAALLAVQQQVAEVIALIDAIGEVECTAECKSKIDTARAAYDALDSDNQTLVTNADILFAAEAAYEAARPYAIVTKEPQVFDTLVYNGAGQTILANGTAVGGQFMYSLDSVTWSTYLPQFKDAGTHTFYCYVDSTDALHRPLPAYAMEVTIAKAALTVTADDKETVYGLVAPNFSVSYTGLLSGDQPADVLTGELTYECAYTVGSNVGPYDIIPSGVEAANYDITFVKGVLTVYKADPAFTEPVAGTLTYNGGAQSLVTAGETAHGIMEYNIDDANDDKWSTELPQAKEAGTYSVYYRVVGDDNHNDYEAADAIVVTIAKAALTVTADDMTVTYGDAVPAYSVTYAGWQGEDNETVLSGTITYACEYAQGSPAGEYTITPSGVSNPNYEITFVNGTLTVTVSDKPTAVEDISVESEKAQKIMHEGMLYIIRPDGAIYNATGVRVK